MQIMGFVIVICGICDIGFRSSLSSDACSASIWLWLVRCGAIDGRRYIETSTAVRPVYLIHLLFIGIWPSRLDVTVRPLTAGCFNATTLHPAWWLVSCVSSTCETAS